MTTFTLDEMREAIAEERERRDPTDAYLASEVLANMLEQVLGRKSRVGQLFGREVALKDVSLDEIERRAVELVDEANGLYADAERLQGEVTRRRAAEKMRDGDTAALIVRIANELGRAPSKMPAYYANWGNWVIEWSDRALNLDGEAFLQLEGAELEYFIREEIAACLAAPSRDPEQR